MEHLPPTPVFLDLFWNRSKVQSCLAALAKKEVKKVEFLKKIEDEPKPEGERKSNLMDLFKKARAEIKNKD